MTLSDIDVAGGQAAAAELPGARLQAADMTKSADIERLVADTIAAEGQVDILVNNAGIQYVASITEFPEAKWRQIIAMHAALVRRIGTGQACRVQHIQCLSRCIRVAVHAVHLCPTAICALSRQDLLAGGSNCFCTALK